MHILNRLILIPALVLVAYAAEPIINTIAGGVDYSGPASAFNGGAPWGVAVDTAGNTYFSVYRRHSVYKIDTSGNLTRVIGHPAGIPGNAPEGSLAINGGILSPMGIAVDAAGNLYIAEADAHRIRKVSPSGIATTFAGTGLNGFSGDGGLATLARLDRPSAVAVDSAGDVYIAEVGSARIRKVSGGIIQTVAGNGVQAFHAGGPATSIPAGCPYQMGIAPDGSLYYADDCGNSVRRLYQGTLTAVAGTGVNSSGPDGPALSTSLARPNGLAVDSSGVVYFTEDHRLRRLSGGTLTTIAGTGAAGWNGDGPSPTTRLLNAPRGLALAGTSALLFTDYFNSRLRRLDIGAAVSTLTGNDNPWGTAVTPTGYTFLNFAEPAGIARDSAGNVYFVDRVTKTAYKRGASGDITLLAGGGEVAAPTNSDLPVAQLGMTQPIDIAVTPNGGVVYILDGQVNNVYRVTAAGVRRVAGNYTSGTAADGAAAATSPLNIPQGIATDAAGNLYVSEYGAHRVSRVDSATGLIARFAGSGVCASYTDNQPALTSSLCNPLTLALDNGGRLHIALNASRIVKLDGGNVVAVAGNGIAGQSADGAPALSPIGTLAGMAFDPDNNLFFAELGQSRVRKLVAATGQLFSVAGTGTPGFTGDGGLAFDARLNNPRGILAGQYSALTIADTMNGRLRATGPYLATLNYSVTPTVPMYGQTAVLNISITPSAAAGTVTFLDGGTVLGSVPLVNGAASITTPPLALGIHEFHVNYPGGNLREFFLLDQRNVVKSTQQVTIAPIPDKLVGAAPFAVSASATSGLPVTLVIASGPATISGNIVTVTGIGVVVVEAYQVGDANYHPSEHVFRSFNVLAAPTDALGPVATNANASPNPVIVGTSVALSATISDASTGNSLIAAAEYRLNGGAWIAMSAADGTFNAVSESVTATIPAFADTGVHEVCFRGRDAAGNNGAPVCILLAVYDPSAGSVTGGGWITSPAGAYADNAALTGRANFGFVSRYQNGANTPTGNTQFQFQAAGFNFKSTAYEWLVVAGSRAQFKGSGTVNGAGDFAFLLTAIDGSPDRFRLKVWNKQSGGVIYDNQMGQSDIGEDSTELGGGSIIIHR